MVEIHDPQVAYQQINGVIQLGIGPTSISLLNLGALGAQTSGTVINLAGQRQNFSIRQPDGSDSQVTVGETFTLTRTVTSSSGAVVGTPTSTSYTMVGSGTVTGTLGVPRSVILARDPVTNQQLFIYPDNSPPTLGLVSLTYDIDAVGYNFDTNAPLCFARGTRLSTPEGQRAIEDLQAGDLVWTRDNGPQPIRWIGRRVIPAAMLERSPQLRPVVIRAGALGAGTPEADLVVSPQHRILVRSTIARRMFSTDEVLVAAKQLLQIDGVDVHAPGDGVEYIHMLFDRHEVVHANGAEAESLFTGPEAIKTVGPAALEEIYAIFPELREDGPAPASARTLPSGRMGRKLVSRHVQHNRPLVAML